MMSLSTAFKRIFGEALTPYGFVKIKGRQPYFVRLVGDEILQVISYKNEWNMNPYKSFNILGGITTVYRRSLCLDESPRDNTEWMSDNFRIYGELHPYGESEEGERILKFSYKKDNETSLLTEVKYSLEVTEKLLLPELLNVTDLKSCVEYYRRFYGPILRIYADEDFGQKSSGASTNEGLLNLKVFNLKEYIEHSEKSHERWYSKKINAAESIEQKRAFETMERNSKEAMFEQIASFKKLYEDPDMYANVMEELERRKTENLKTLRLYGVVE